MNTAPGWPQPRAPATNGDGRHADVGPRLREGLWRWSARPVARLAAVVACFALIGCDLVDDFQHKRKLEALVRRGATLDEVARELGSGYVLSEKGTPSWDPLQAFLDREPVSDLRPLRENVPKYPKVMYYTTAWRMTWIFFDDKDVIRAYHLTAQ